MLTCSLFVNDLICGSLSSPKIALIFKEQISYLLLVQAPFVFIVIGTVCGMHIFLLYMVSYFFF